MKREREKEEGLYVLCCECVCLREWFLVLSLASNSFKRQLL